MLWIKVFHVVFFTSWFAGLFYLPRLFVYHAMSENTQLQATFKVMERKLYYGIMTPAMILTIVTGLWMVFDYAWAASSGMKWLHVKITLALGLVVYHLLCGCWLKKFAADQNIRSHKFYRWMNEIPLVFLITMVALVLLKPF